MNQPWRENRGATGTSSPWPNSVRPLPPLFANCTKGSAVSASCAPGNATRWCSPPMAARQAFASIRSKRNRSITSCRERRSFLSEQPAATSPASSARTGTSRRPALSIGYRILLRPRRSRGRARSLGRGTSTRRRTGCAGPRGICEELGANSTHHRRGAPAIV